MADKTQYTRCPRCETVFKVTDKMLAMAQGKVRCGACLVVFQATDHLLQPSNPEADVPNTPPSATHAQESHAPQESDFKLDDFPQVPTVADPLLQQPAFQDNREPEITEQESFQLDAEREPDEGHEQERQWPAADEPQVIDESIIDVDLELSTASELFTASDGESALETEFDLSTESLETLAENDDLSLEGSETEAFESDELTQEEASLELLADNLTSQIQEVDTAPDPLDEFEAIVAPKKTGLRNGIIVSSVMILLVIGSFKFWNNRQQLAWDETWGSTTQSVCAVLPCGLKPQRDVSKIRLRQRIVMPAEERENVLEVKILLTNEASFAQPFPRITIKFSNSRGESVATKHYAVADYFPEKQGQLMPASAEVHISFETELPHPDALGFEFIFD